jgi:hypothetical protein
MTLMDGKVLSEVVTLLLIIGVSGGFGGLVSALQKTHYAVRKDGGEYQIKYILPCPLNPSKPKKLGFFGDLIVGAASGISIFVGLEGILGLDLKLQDGLQAIYILRLIAIGVVSGYMGAGLLDAIALEFSSHLIKKRQKYTIEEQNLSEMERRIAAASDVNRLRWIGDFFRKVEHYDKALEFYDGALIIDPADPHTVIHRSFVITALARKEGGVEKQCALYRSVLRDMDKIIESSNETSKANKYIKGRGYYNRACFKVRLHVARGQLETEKVQILDDLSSAIKLDEIFAQMADCDPDFNELKNDNKFREIVSLAPLDQ